MVLSFWVRGLSILALGIDLSTLQQIFIHWFLPRFLTSDLFCKILPMASLTKSISLAWVHGSVQFWILWKCRIYLMVFVDWCPSSQWLTPTQSKIWMPYNTLKFKQSYWKIETENNLTSKCLLLCSTSFASDILTIACQWLSYAD